MARKKDASLGNDDDSVLDYRFDTKRKLIPPAGFAAQAKIAKVAKSRYEYNPHLPPVLRFDESGESDKLPDLIEKATQGPITPEEARILAEALKNHEPWLEWAGKREAKYCEVDPVALHIHERVSTQALLRMAKREDIPRTLFADPELEYQEAVKFYQHDVDWANRMILGDSLAVMASLSRRENLAGKVQMIYMDPPYGIKYASNFQPEVGKRNVTDKSQDLTREPEMVKAYRDTWNLGVHSYLSYLRDRLYAAKELLADTGSIFVQMNDENLDRVRALLDEVFGSENFIVLISYVTTSGFPSNTLSRAGDYVLWYAKNSDRVRFRRLYRGKELGDQGAEEYKWLMSPDGSTRSLTPEEWQEVIPIPQDSRRWRYGPLSSSGYSAERSKPYEFQGKLYPCGDGNHWKADLTRIEKAGLLVARDKSLSWYMFADNYPVVPMNNNWIDTKWGFDAGDKLYAVQTNAKVIERCLLMTTDPGDLVLDPTCGSGTTAYVSEKWGRRWITVDTSRVAIAIARQRLLTAKFDYCELRSVDANDLARNPDGAWLPDPRGGTEGACTFDCKRVPHIMLKSIAQNQALDPIFEKFEPILADKLGVLNKALRETVTNDIRHILHTKLLTKQKAEGKKAITDADRRRWSLPESEWQDWEVPFDTDPDWPKALQDALNDYRKAWRAKMDEVNACIAARADMEELVDQPSIDRKTLRVSGPFTVEGVLPAEDSIDPESPIGGEPEEMETFDGEIGNEDAPTNAEAFVDRMVRLLRTEGAGFSGGTVQKFTRLERATGDVLHAEGEWETDEGTKRVAVAIGPQYGPVTAWMVEQCLWAASRRGYDVALFAGLSFDGAAQAAIQADPNPRVRALMTQIRPDVNMGDLLKDTPSSQIFTVCGTPRTRLETLANGEYQVIMEGVDVYDPVGNTLRPTGADKVAAWFLDSDYDGKTFCITQAFFPDKKAWEKLSKALTGVVDAERFEAFAGTESLPFPAGEYRIAAVKVIDPRGHELMRVHSLDKGPKI